MLARGTRSVYICLKCQRSLVGDGLALPGAKHSASGPVLRRWQSAVTRRLTHDDIDNGPDNDSTPETNHDPQTQHRTPLQHHGKRQFWRNWKPNPTAELGVNSLGKPAEVLLLPSRDRRIPQVPKGDGKERAGATLQESIDSEKVPLSGAKLSENIEQVRTLVGKMRGQLEKHEWKTIKKHLRTGFQTSQLKQYLRLRKGDLPRFRKNPTKEDFIRYLVEEIWGFTTPVREESAATPEKIGRKVIKLSFNVRDPATLGHLLTHPSQPLKKIAEDHDVQIDVHPSFYKIKVMGTRHDANQAVQAIARYTKDLGKIIIQLKGPVGAVYQDHKLNDYLKAYLSSLQQKYQGLNIALDMEKITIVHRDTKRVADQARREILLSIPPSADWQNSTMWPSSENLRNHFQPFPTPSELPIALHQLSWQRVVSNVATPKSPARVNLITSFNQALQDLRDVFDINASLANTSSRQNHYYELTARFGQTLIQEAPRPYDGDEDEFDLGRETELTELAERSSSKENKPGALDKENSPRTNTEPSAQITAELQAPDDTGQNSVWEGPPQPHVPNNIFFVGGAPFLAQHLASLDPWASSSSASSPDVDEEARAMLRLELSPILTSNSHGAPTFEILVNAGEERDGKRPRLVIAKASAVYEEMQFGVLCPRNEVDVMFTRQLKQDLFYPGSKETSVVQSLMNTLRGYIGSAQSTGSSDWVFPPFVHLTIQHSLGGTLKDVEPAAGKSPPGRPKGKTPGMADRKLEYLLRTVDIVDVDSRLVSVDSASKTSKKKQSQSHSRNSFCLDHITYTGADATRQELRLGQIPMLYPPVLKQPDLPTFLRAALSLVEQFSWNPLKSRPKPESLLPEIGEKDIMGNSPSFKPQPGQKKNMSKPSKKAAVKQETSVPVSRKDDIKVKENSPKSPVQPGKKTVEEPAKNPGPAKKKLSKAFKKAQERKAMAKADSEAKANSKSKVKAKPKPARRDDTSLQS